MSLIDNDAMRLITKIFDLPNSQIAGVTNLDDGDVTQVLAINELVRRGLTQGHDGGWFLGVLENVHSGVDDEESEIFPYSVGASANAPFPAAVPEGWDLWLAGVSGIQSAGSGAQLTGALMRLDVPDEAVGWGQDDTGAPVVDASPPITLASFSALITNVGALAAPMETDGGDTFVRVNLRLPRACSLIFSTESAGAATFQGVFMMGLFPQAMGQDIAY